MAQMIYPHSRIVIYCMLTLFHKILVLKKRVMVCFACHHSVQKAFVLLHDKTNKMIYAPGQDSYRPGHLPSLISLHCPHEEALDP